VFRPPAPEVDVADGELPDQSSKVGIVGILRRFHTQRGHCVAGVMVPFSVQATNLRVRSLVVFDVDGA
jgi:hypothetical protein